MKFFLLYLLIVNAGSFVLMLIDKYKAKNHLWRIPESTLILSAAIGGSIGALTGMYLVRHKTKRPKFTIGVPIILVIQLILIIFGAFHFYA